MLDTLIAPTTLETFFSHYYEKHPLVLKRKNPGHLSELFAESRVKPSKLYELETLLASHTELVQMKRNLPKQSQEHDLFVLQTNGLCQWKIFSSTEEAPLYELSLEKGDSLYIPRNFFYEATFLEQNDPSILFIQSHVPSILDFFLELLNSLSEQESLFKKSFQDDPYQEQVLFERLLSKENVLQTLETLKVQRIQNGSCYLEAQVSELLKQRNVNDDSFYQVRKNLACHLSQREKKCALYFLKDKKQFDASYEETLSFVLSKKPFQVKELPGSLSPHEKRQLIQDLYQSSLITTC